MLFFLSVPQGHYLFDIAEGLKPFFKTDEESSCWSRLKDYFKEVSVEIFFKKYM